mgnify:CR=1 FL=1
MSLGGLIQVARVFAPSANNGKTRKSAAATTGTTGQNIATAITKLTANCPEGAVAFVADQDGRLLFGTAAVTATAAAGIPIAARVPYVVWVHRVTSTFFSYYNSSATAGGIEYWDPEKP